MFFDDPDGGDFEIGVGDSEEEPFLLPPEDDPGEEVPAWMYEEEDVLDRATAVAACLPVLEEAEDMPTSLSGSSSEAADASPSVAAASSEPTASATAATASVPSPSTEGGSGPRRSVVEDEGRPVRNGFG